MKEDYNGDLYDVYYRDGNGEKQCVCYFGYSKRDAERLFNSEKCVGEEIKEGMENCLLYVPVAKINLHNKKSLSSETVFSTILLPLEKALKIFGDCEVMYPQIIVDDEKVARIKFGIVVED